MGAYIPADVPGLLHPWNSTTQPVPVPPGTPAPPVTQTLDLESLANEQEGIFKSYNGRSLAIPDQPAYDARPPYIEMPGGGQPYFANSPIQTPTNDGNDYTVVSFTLPFGWDGRIDKLACYYTGPGFIPGSGFLTWRLLKNNQAIKGYDAIQFCIGAFGQGGIQPMDLSHSPIRTYAGETISLVVNHAVASTLPIVGTFVYGIIGGYNYATK